jgi:predicted TIM-barrel fold metal-dependent hydrolase
MPDRSRSAQIRARLDHPVIDTDGHCLEYLPLFHDYLREAGGPKLLERFRATPRGENFHELTPWNCMTPAERHDRRAFRPVWWVKPTRNTLDRATAMLPELLHQRMDELGFDYAILYPTAGLTLILEDDAEIRRAACHAFNAMQADLYRPYAARMTPAAVIPAHTPEEAIAELDHAVRTLGLKVAMVASNIRRPVPWVAREAPAAAPHALWVDTLGLDSAYDYDPLWAKCLELKVAVTSHSHIHGVGLNTSISNYVYNHIGKFGFAGEAFCKALFLGGVTRRFPALHFAFLEGGVGWACHLYTQLVSHWEKRHPGALGAIDPANLDVELMRELFGRYGSALVRGRLEQLPAALGSYAARREAADSLDEFAAACLDRVEDIHQRFVPSFWFGCEADDPSNAWAFGSNGMPKLNAMFGSDIGHWDVPAMNGVLEEAWELVEHGQIDEAGFRDFVFAHPARLHAGMNPEFFRGTVVEEPVRRLLESDGTAADQDQGLSR